MRVPEHVAGKFLRQTLQSVRSIHRPTEPVAAASALSTESPRTTAEAPSGVARAVAAPARTERRLWRWRLEAVGFEGEAARRQVHRANPDMGAATLCRRRPRANEPRAREAEITAGRTSRADTKARCTGDDDTPL